MNTNQKKPKPILFISSPSVFQVRKNVKIIDNKNYKKIKWDKTDNKKENINLVEYFTLVNRLVTLFSSSLLIPNLDSTFFCCKSKVLGDLKDRLKNIGNAKSE